MGTPVLRLFFRCGYSQDLLAALQVNPDRPTPFFASVATLAVLALPLIIALTRTFVLTIIASVDKGIEAESVILYSRLTHKKFCEEPVDGCALLDIPNGLGPAHERTVHWMFFTLLAQGRAVRVPQRNVKEKRPRIRRFLVFLIRGCLVGLEPTVSRSTIWRVNRLR